MGEIQVRYPEELGADLTLSQWLQWSVFICFLTCLITQRQKPKTGRVQGDEILHILKQRQSTPESNSTKLSSFSLPVRAFLFISKTTYNYLLTVSGFIVKISVG